MSASKGTKTVRVAHLLDMHERFERHHMPDKSDEELRALRVFVETVLFVTGNYEGFSEPEGSSRRYFRNERTK